MGITSSVIRTYVKPCFTFQTYTLVVLRLSIDATSVHCVVRHSSQQKVFELRRNPVR